MDSTHVDQRKTIEDVVVVGEEEGGLYKLKGHPETTLVHEITSIFKHI